MNDVDVARQIKVKTICGPNLNLRPDLSIYLSTFTPCRITHSAHHERNVFKYVSGAGPLFTSRGYPPLVTIMSQKPWFEGGVIQKALVGILEEDENDE